MAEKKTKKKGFSLLEKFKYRAKNSKKGSTYTDKNGEVKPYSDFKRGEMVGKNKAYAEQNRMYKYNQNKK
jgi:hypothetical protein